MPTELSELSKPQIFIVALPDGRIEVTVNGHDGHNTQIVRFELLPAQARGMAADILNALARSALRKSSKH